jgi:16S rRNA (guanine527-N7)-methyltransferase
MSREDPWSHLLAEGLRDLGVEPSPDVVARLCRFTALLERWGKVYNLTAIEQPEDVIRLHLLDSLSIWPHVRGPRVLDVGTGAGLPGVPLAVVLPDLRFDLLDRSAKKIRFVTQTAIELGLKNVHPVQRRIEDYRPDGRFDSIVVRAYGSVTEIWQQTRHLLSEQGVILAMKGRSPETMVENVESARVRIIPLLVPGLDAQRHLVELAPLR